MCWKEGKFGCSGAGRQASSWQELAGPPAVPLTLWVTVEFGSGTQCRLAATCTSHMTHWLCFGQHSQALQVFWGSWQVTTRSYRSTGCSGRLDRALKGKAVVSVIPQHLQRMYWATKYEEYFGKKINCVYSEASPHAFKEFLDLGKFTLSVTFAKHDYRPSS